MRLRISHTTRYSYDQPVPRGLQQLRLRPKATAAQQPQGWSIEVGGGTLEARFEDQHRNSVDLVSFVAGTRELVITALGEVETTDTSGVIGAHGGFAPLWLFDRVTPLTRAGAAIRRLSGSVASEKEVLPRMHALMAAVADAVRYLPGRSSTASTAEEVLAAGEGVCQDMTHVFIAAARAGGVPARYVSGYLYMPEGEEQDATHAWAEAHVPGLGWVGFDCANAKCPDEGYIRIATGLDYTEAAPVSGLRMGGGDESLSVSVTVASDVQHQTQSQMQG